MDEKVEKNLTFPKKKNIFETLLTISGQNLGFLLKVEIFTENTHKNTTKFKGAVRV